MVNSHLSVRRSRFWEPVTDPPDTFSIPAPYEYRTFTDSLKTMRKVKLN